MGNRTYQWAAIAALGFILVAVESTRAATPTMLNTGSGVKAFFSAQSDAAHVSDPVGATWVGPGVTGPYASGSAIPTLPAAPAPAVSPAGGNAFGGGGTGYTDTLTDGITIGVANIADNFLTSPTLTANTSIAIPSWTFTQPVAATGYAYEQLNFGSNYSIVNNPGLGGSTPSIPLFISGSVIAAPGAFAQFDGVVNYTWIPSAIDAAGFPTGIPGSPVSLGTLSYAYSSIGGGPFAATVNSTGSLAATPAGNGVLVLTGEMWIAGDPFTLHVTSVAPEPASLALLSLGGMMFVGRRKVRAAI